MLNLTRQEQGVLAVVLGLVLVGLVVKAWRTAHPPEPLTPAAVTSP